MISIDTSRAKSNLPVVRLSAYKLGFIEYPKGRNDGEPCDIYWHNVSYNDMKDIVYHPTSKVNKFPGMNELSKKIRLTKAIDSMQRLFPQQYDFYPKSWFIPSQLDEFRRDFDRNRNENDESWFIVKPDEGAQGVGIYLIKNATQIQQSEQPQLIQKYICEPFLFRDRLKFDLRVYAVIRSINPLSVYVAREGMVRFCTEKYNRPSFSNQDQLFVHLTNYSLNKENDGYIHSNTLEEQLKGSKRLLSTVFQQMKMQGIRTKRIWHDIKLILVKTILAMVPEMMLNYEFHFANSVASPQCFQILGFDILLTKDLKPVLLEVNASPSLTIEHHILPQQTDQQFDLLTSIEPDFDQKSDAELPNSFISVVDAAIKVPLVRDALLLVMEKLNSVYDIPGSKFNSTDVINNSSGKNHYDFFCSLRRKKPHLTEIFPLRYGRNCWQLLFLDKAVYLYMQFVNSKKTLCISVNGFRTFIRKCNLGDLISPEALALKFTEINRQFEGQFFNGVPFHGFLDLLFELAPKKYPNKCARGQLVESVRSLLTFCESMLRKFGVRSSRLRRVVKNRDDKRGPMEIYLLPERIGACKKRAKFTTLNRDGQFMKILKRKTNLEKISENTRSFIPFNRTANLPKIS